MLPIMPEPNTPPTSPREALAHTLAVFADEVDSGMAVVATRNQPVRGAVTGLTWGDLRALAAEAGTTAASTALNPEYLAEIAARAEAATAGPWCTDGAEIYQGDEYTWNAFWVGETCRADEADGGTADAAFIAAARTDVPALLAEVERLRAELSASPVRTERSRWQAVADALNAIDVLGIDLDGTITDHTAWSVVWDRNAERWTVSGYDAEAGESR
ncbi:hypothetical protein Salbus254_5874 [Streptomyces albidoflavus]|uniref:hypothetical protein n=1 Tax=Streptomyces albidoflavus TaxID=1886 RepID=UPI0007757316|nr:hypothetical protein [Streptomyces albidoflavus]AMM12302.1 hypothetical protein Salbus254_5874 [Streptomyces albidoflavus]